MYHLNASYAIEQSSESWHIYEPVNQNNSVPTGSFWLPERQNRICDIYIYPMPFVYASGRVLLCDCMIKLPIRDMALHGVSAMQCLGRLQANRNGSCPPPQKTIRCKSKILKPLRRRSCMKIVYPSVETTCSHRDLHWSELNRSKRPLNILYKKRYCSGIVALELKMQAVEIPRLHQSHWNHWIHHCPPWSMLEVTLHQELISLNMGLCSPNFA